MNALSHCNRQTTVPVPSHYSILYTDKLLGVNFVIQTHVLTPYRVVTVIGGGTVIEILHFFVNCTTALYQRLGIAKFSCGSNSNSSY